MYIPDLGRASIPSKHDLEDMEECHMDALPLPLPRLIESCQKELVCTNCGVNQCERSIVHICHVASHCY